MSEEQNNDQQKSLNDEQIINKNTKEKTDLSKDAEGEKILLIKIQETLKRMVEVIIKDAREMNFPLM